MLALAASRLSRSKCLIDGAVYQVLGNLLMTRQGPVGVLKGAAALITDESGFYAQQAFAVLSKYGADAHLYIPGVGAVSGFQAGNYLESAGNTNASVDGVVGLVLDAAGSVGAELATATSTTLAGTTGFMPDNAPSLAANKTYRVSYSYIVSSGSAQMNVAGVVMPVMNVGSGSYSGVVTTSATGVARIYSNAATGSITSISVREVTGTHATQTTTANKPMLRRGSVNLLSNSADLAATTWTKAASSVSSAGETAPSGTPAQLLTSTGSFAAAYPMTAIPASAGQTVTMAFEVKAGSGATTATLADESQGGSCYSHVSLTNGAAGTTGFVTSASSVDLGNGWYLATATYTVQAGKTSVTPKFWVGLYSGTSTAGQSIKIGRVGLFQGSLTADQILAAGGIPQTTTAPASSSKGALAWSFDGTNDALLLPAPLFQMADDHCVVVAASPAILDGVARRIFTQENGVATVCEIEHAFALSIVWRDDAGTLSAVSTAGVVDQPLVISGRKIGNAKIGRKNGVQFGTDSTVIGTTTLGTTPCIGNRPAGDRAWNGRIYPVIAIKGTVSDADLKTLEKWLGSIAGVQIQ